MGKFLQKYGYAVLRFNDNDVLTNLEAVLQEITNKYKNLQVFALSPCERVEFLNERSEFRNSGEGFRVTLVCSVQDYDVTFNARQ